MPDCTPHRARRPAPNLRGTRLAQAALAALAAGMACLAAGAFAAPGGLPLPSAAEPARPAGEAAQPLAQVRKLLDERQWPAAIAELKRLNTPTSADWNNLMGFAHRKASPPDLVAASAYYETALRIDAGHRGALEYSGELALVKGDLADAERRRARLARACGGPCEELSDLDEAIARFKAAGGRYVARD